MFKAEWQARLEAQASSGLTISTWCKREQITKSCFYEWRQRLSKAVKAVQAAPQLIAVPLSNGGACFAVVAEYTKRLCDSIESGSPSELAARHIESVTLGFLAPLSSARKRSVCVALGSSRSTCTRSQRATVALVTGWTTVAYINR